MPINARTVITRSDSLPAVTAEMMPTRTPKNSQMTAAPIQSENVAGMPLLICWTTLSWLEYETSEPLGGRDARRAVGDHRPPRRARRLYACAQERQSRLREDVVRDDQREDHEHRRSDVRQQFIEHRAPRARSLRRRGFDELLLAQRQDLAAQRPADVGNQYDGDHERWDPEAARLDVDAEVVEAVDRESGSERDRKQQH